MKTQRRSWLPVLTSAWFFAALGVMLLPSGIGSFLYPSYLFPMTSVVDAFLLFGLVTLTLATSRFLALRSKYGNAKRVAPGK